MGCLGNKDTIKMMMLMMLMMLSQNVFVVRTITQDAFGGLISPRDFVDLVINEKTNDYLSTNCKITHLFTLGNLFTHICQLS